MNSIGFFLMGKKGLSVLNGIIKGNPEYLETINFIVCAKDKSIENDYYNEIKDYSKRYGIKFFNRKEVTVSTLESNYSFAIGWRWLIRDISSNLIVLHDSLLPKYRGFNPLVTALIEGDKKIGVTAIEANEEFDSGDIYDQRVIEIDYPIRIKEAIDLISDLYIDITLNLIKKIREKNLRSFKQDESKVSYSIWRNEEDYRVEWDQSSDRIERFVNAVGFPYKGAVTSYNGKRIRLVEVKSEDDLPIINRKPGKILKIKGNYPFVVCEKGLIKIIEARLEKDGSIFKFDRLRVRLK